MIIAGTAHRTQIEDVTMANLTKLVYDQVVMELDQIEDPEVRERRVIETINNMTNYELLELIDRSAN